MTALAALERALALDPDDRELRMVFADAATEHGDPRGELIVLADRLETATATDEHRRRARELRLAEERALDAPFARLGWRHGLIHRVDLVGNPSLDAIAAFLARPELRFIRELDLRTFASETAPSRRAVIDLLLELAPRPPLRWIGLGSGRLSPEAPQVRELRRVFDLRGMAVFAEETDVALAMTAGLVDLEIGACDLDGWMVGELLAQMPAALERLVLHTNIIAIADLAALFAPGAFPALRHLGVMAGDVVFSGALLQAIVECGLIDRLASLGLPISDDPEWLVAHAARLANVRLFSAPLGAVRYLGEWPGTWHALGHAYVTLGRHADALAEFDALATIAPKESRYQVDIGEQLATLDRHPESLAAFERAVACDPASARALTGRGLALQELGRPSEALPDWERLEAIGVTEAYVWNNRGHALLQQGRYDDALAAFDAAIARKPSGSWALENRGLVLGHLGRTTEALAAYRQVLDHANRTQDVLLGATSCAQIARLYRASRRGDLARRFLERAAKHVMRAARPHAVEVGWIVRLHGALLVDQGDHAAAMGVWRTATRDPDVADDGHIGEGWTQLELEHPTRALAAFARASYVDYHGQALALLAAGRAAEARALLNDELADESCPYNVAASALVDRAIAVVTGSAAWFTVRETEVDVDRGAAALVRNPAIPRIGELIEHACAIDSLSTCHRRAAVASLALAQLAGEPAEVAARLRALTTALEAGHDIGERMWEVRAALRHLGPVAPDLDLALRVVEGSAPISELAAQVRPRRTR